MAFPEPLSDKEDDVDSVGDGNIAIGLGRKGARKFITESIDMEIKHLGLRFNRGELVFDTEVVGEGDFEHGYEVVLELQLLLPKLSTPMLLKTLRELDSMRPGLAVDSLGEKNSSPSEPPSKFL